MTNLKDYFLFLTIACLTILLSSGCSPHSQNLSIMKQAVYDPPLSRHAGQIIKGKTTRAEILEWFGVPYLEADENKVTLFPDSPLALERKKNQEALARFKETYKEYCYFGQADSANSSTENIDNDYYEKVASLHPYSSIDDAHVVLLFLESKSSTESGQTGDTPAISHQLTTFTYYNRLLVFIDKKTDIVDQFSFREEFSAE